VRLLALTGFSHPVLSHEAEPSVLCSFRSEPRSITRLQAVENVILKQGPPRHEVDSPEPTISTPTVSDQRPESEESRRCFALHGTYGTQWRNIVLFYRSIAVSSPCGVTIDAQSFKLNIHPFAVLGERKTVSTLLRLNSFLFNHDKRKTWRWP